MMRVACQTYTWEMLGSAWTGTVTDILDAIADAGYAGIEITSNMIGEFADRPAEFARELRRRSLELATFCCSTGTGFADPDRRDSDLAAATRAIAFTQHFPGARLQFGSARRADCRDRGTALGRAIDFYNTAGGRARAAGIAAHVHPNSAPTSLLLSAAEYQQLADDLDPDVCRLAIDTGHVVRGGQDLLSCVRTHLPRLVHVHVKDVTGDGSWAPLGQGACDIAGVLELLRAARYDGWIVAEEESDAARRDPAGAIRHNREYLRTLGLG